MRRFLALLLAVPCLALAQAPEGAAPAIYRAARQSDKEPFAAPQRVSAITGFVEAPALSPDGRALYYHKLEDGRFVIYRVAR
jgi:hypothetical protein